jgi:hypothetical protein
MLRRNERDTIENVMYASFLSFLIKLVLSPHILKKYSNTKFHANPSSGSRAVPCGRRDRQTKLVVAFRSFVNAPKTVSVPDALDIRNLLYEVNFFCETLKRRFVLPVR